MDRDVILGGYTILYNHYTIYWKQTVRKIFFFPGRGLDRHPRGPPSRRKSDPAREIFLFLHEPRSISPSLSFTMYITVLFINQKSFYITVAVLNLHQKESFYPFFDPPLIFFKAIMLY